MIDVKRIRHLRAVAEYPTVQAAADSLNLTQSALTKSIARFESDLGAPLFDRKGHRLTLTELGERLVDRGELLLREIDRMEEEVVLWKGLGAGEVTLGVDPEAEFDLLPGVLEDYIPAHPGIAVSLRTGQTDTLLPDLLNGDLHFMLADAELARDHPELEIRTLVSTPIAAAVRLGHQMEGTTDPSPEEVARFPFTGASTAPRFEQWRAESGRREGLEPFIPSLVSDNYELLVRLAERSDSIVFGPLDLLKGYEKEGRVTILEWPLEGPAIQTSLIRTSGRQLSPAAEHMIDLIMRAAETRTNQNQE